MKAGAGDLDPRGEGGRASITRGQVALILPPMGSEATVPYLGFGVAV